jgi:hypothetical protein
MWRPKKLGIELMKKKLNHTFKYLNLILQMIIFLFIPSAFGADTSIAEVEITSNVPVVFSVTARGQPGDLDLSPNVIVNNRLIGLLHFKYNVNVASLTISSSTASGGPVATSGAVYNFQGGFKVSIPAPCASVDPSFNTPFILSNAGTDVKSIGSTALTAGIEEDCSVAASWKGTNVGLPLAGVYKLSILVTFTSI